MGHYRGLVFIHTSIALVQAGAPAQEPQKAARRSSMDLWHLAPRKEFECSSLKARILQGKTIEVIW